jgi:hypothetical protein
MLAEGASIMLISSGLLAASDTFIHRLAVIRISSERSWCNETGIFRFLSCVEYCGRTGLGESVQYSPYCNGCLRALCAAMGANMNL